MLRGLSNFSPSSLLLVLCEVIARRREKWESDNVRLTFFRAEFRRWQEMIRNEPYAL